MGAVSPGARRFLERGHRLFIGGKWVDSGSARLLVEDPASGSTVSSVPAATAGDVDRAVAAARRAFDDGPWPRLPPVERTRLLLRLADLIDQAADELAELETIDNGKLLADARSIDVPSASAILRYMAGWATKLEGGVVPVGGAPVDTYHAYTRLEPVGVVGQIIPWNFPLVMAAWKLAPALAAGCTVVLKPAEQTPLTALRLAEVVEAAGFPGGVVNVVTGDGPTAGAALAAHDGVDKIAFTGSVEVGKTIVERAAGNLKRVSLELGGKSPNVILADADLDRAIEGAASAIFFNQGQACSAGARLYVHASRYDEVLSRLAAAARRIRVGPGLDPSSQMGPLVSGAQLDRVLGYVSAGVREGAELVAGGERIARPGYFVQPTVFARTRPEMRIVTEEIFGPVVCVIPFREEEELIAAANRSSYGLAAGVWTRDVAAAHRVAARLKAGTVWVNCYGVFDPALPFGGFKQSGWGREMGRQVLDLYTESKLVCVKL